MQLKQKNFPRLAPPRRPRLSASTNFFNPFAISLQLGIGNPPISTFGTPIMTAPMHGVAEIVEAELAHIPLRRFGYVTEIAPTVAFLCTEQGSYTSGAVFVVDGASDCV